ncbi:hypothetical protein JCM1841_002669 [Sporobolomyces salmonicolor]
MDSWGEELSTAFLPIPWSSFPSSSSPSGNLLLKCFSDDGIFAILATDLEQVYFDSLNRRQLGRRVDDALNSSAQTQSQSQGVIAGIGEDGEKLLQDSVHLLLEAVRSGQAKAELVNEAFEHILSITVPGRFTIRFLMMSLEQQSAAALASHLISPLLGVSSGLLALLREAIPDEETLLNRVESVADASGRAERLSAGRACRTWFRVGGAALLGRWTQRFTCTKDRHIQPISLSLPTARSSRPTLFSAASRSPLKSRRSPSASPPLGTTLNHASTPSKLKAGFAHQMVDHGAAGLRGEKIGWDDTQPIAHGSITGFSGQVNHVEDEPITDPAEENAQEEEEPATEEEDESAPSPSGFSLPPSSRAAPSVRHRSELAFSPPSATATTASGTRPRAPTPTLAGSQEPSQSLRSSSALAEGLEAPDEKARRKEEAKERKRKQEEQEEKERRRERLKKLKDRGAAQKKAPMKKRL